MNGRKLWLAGLLILALMAYRHRTQVQAWAYGVKSDGRQVGTAAAELPPSAKTLDGKPLRVADARGRVLLLHFWTSGGLNCKRMIPRYGEGAQKFGAQGL